MVLLTDIRLAWLRMGSLNRKALTTQKPSVLLLNLQHEILKSTNNLSKVSGIQE